MSSITVVIPKELRTEIEKLQSVWNDERFSQTCRRLIRLALVQVNRKEEVGV